MKNTVTFVFNEMDLNITTQAFEFNTFPFLHRNANEDYIEEFNKNYRYLFYNLNLCESKELNEKIQQGNIELELNDAQLDILRAALATTGPHLVEESWREQYKLLAERLMFLTSEASNQIRVDMKKKN